MKIYILFCLLSLVTILLHAQPASIPVASNLTADGIPSLPLALVSEVKNYTEARGASLVSWHPTKKEMLISTRFGNSRQLHYVKFPDGDRKQITFFDEPVGAATFEPTKGDYFLFLKDIGGNEFSQIYRYDIADKKIMLITDGKRSQNGGIRWSSKGDRIAFGSTKRNRQDRDIYVTNPLDPSAEKKVAENSGGGWGGIERVPGELKILVLEGSCVYE